MDNGERVLILVPTGRTDEDKFMMMLLKRRGIGMRDKREFSCVQNLFNLDMSMIYGNKFVRRLFH